MGISVFAVFMAGMAAVATMLGAFALVPLAGDREFRKQLFNFLGTAGRAFDFRLRTRGDGFFEGFTAGGACVLVARHSSVILP